MLHVESRDEEVDMLIEIEEVDADSSTVDLGIRLDFTVKDGDVQFTVMDD